VGTGCFKAIVVCPSTGFPQLHSQRLPNGQAIFRVRTVIVEGVAFTLHWTLAGVGMTLKLLLEGVVTCEPTWLTRPHPSLEVLVNPKDFELLDG